MPKIPPISADKLIKVLEEAGFRVVRQKGSHIICIMEQTLNRVDASYTQGSGIKQRRVSEISKENVSAICRCLIIFTKNLVGRPGPEYARII